MARTIKKNGTFVKRLRAVRASLRYGVPGSTRAWSRDLGWYNQQREIGRVTH